MFDHILGKYRIMYIRTRYNNMEKLNIPKNKIQTREGQKSFNVF